MIDTYEHAVELRIAQVAGSAHVPTEVLIKSMQVYPTGIVIFRLRAALAIAFHS